MGEMRKITAFIPAEILALAQANVGGGAGVTETLRAALEAFNRSAWYRKALDLEGKVTVEIDLEGLREDRVFDEYGNVVD